MRQGIPQRTHAHHQARVVNVFGKIVFIRQQQILLHRAHSLHVLRVGEGLYRFGHTADKIVLAQAVDVFVWGLGSKHVIVAC